MINALCIHGQDQKKQKEKEHLTGEKEINIAMLYFYLFLCLTFLSSQYVLLMDLLWYPALLRALADRNSR